MTLTWPGHRKPSIAAFPSSSNAVIAGTTSLCAASTVKFSIPRRSASRTAAAVAGAVVSNPTATNATCLSGNFSARRTADNAEVTTRTSAPRARCRSRLPSRPGTRTMSPYVATIISRTSASWMAASICRCAVTHTGHPGPLTRRRFSGRRARNPWRNTLTVCVPHTSITCTRRPIARPRRWSSLVSVVVAMRRYAPKIKVQSSKFKRPFRTLIFEL